MFLEFQELGFLPHKARDERTSRGSGWTCGSSLRGCQDSGIRTPARRELLSFPGHIRGSLGRLGPSQWPYWVQLLLFLGQRHAHAAAHSQALSQEQASPNTVSGSDMSSRCLLNTLPAVGSQSPESPAE